MFQFLTGEAKLVEYKGRQLVFFADERYSLRRTHPVSLKLQDHQPAKSLEVFVETSREVKGGFVYVGKVRSAEPALRPLHGNAQRQARRHCKSIRFQGQGCAGRTIDISDRGFQAEFSGKPEIGTKMSLDFKIGSGSVTVVAEARWVGHSSGVGGLVGFQVDPAQGTNRRAMALLQAKQVPQPATVLVHPEAPPTEPAPELRRHKVGAHLRAFSWDGPEGSLLVRFKDARGRVRRLLFPNCQRLKLADARANILVAELSELQPCPGEEAVSGLQDLTRCLYRLEDQHGDLVMEVVSQPFKVLKSDLETRNVVSFRRKSRPLACGF